MDAPDENAYLVFPTPLSIMTFLNVFIDTHVEHTILTVYGIKDTENSIELSLQTQYPRQQQHS